MTTREFQKTILDHYQKHGRKDLPWKKTRDPYKILVSEIMLQQTQVSRVLPKYREFLKAFPTIQALAEAPDTKLLKTWQGLGYWRRAKYLKAATQKIINDPSLSRLFEMAKQVSERSRGNLAGLEVYPAPKAQLSGAGASDWLEQLPGVGPYTARAVACFAFNSPEPFIDTNIRRVYLHFFFSKNPPAGGVSDKDILKIAQATMYRKDPRTWHYALFDYGATVLKNKKINRASKHYTKQSPFIGSFRSLRTSVVQLLLQQPRHTLPHKKLHSFLQQQILAQSMRYTPQEVVSALLKDKLIKKSREAYRV